MRSFVHPHTFRSIIVVLDAIAICVQVDIIYIDIIIQLCVLFLDWEMSKVINQEYTDFIDRINNSILSVISFVKEIVILLRTRLKHLQMRIERRMKSAWLKIFSRDHQYEMKDRKKLIFAIKSRLQCRQIQSLKIFEQILDHEKFWSILNKYWCQLPIIWYCRSQSSSDCRDCYNNLRMRMKRLPMHWSRCTWKQRHEKPKSKHFYHPAKFWNMKYISFDLFVYNSSQHYWIEVRIWIEFR